MSHRSVMETLDLHNGYGEYHSDTCPSQVTFGWLSPRVSFSTEYIEFSPDAPGRSRSARLSPEKKKQMEEEAENTDGYPSEFEFSMSSLNVAGNDTPGFIVPADELFHKGKLLPGYLPRHSTGKDDSVEFDTSSSLPEGSLSCSATTMSRQLNSEGISGPSSLGCVLGPSCLRTPKGPKWRELFGALRRVKSDSGRQRIPDESLLPPKTFQGRKKFFKQMFGARSGPEEQDLKQTTGSAAPHVAPSSFRTSHSSTATASTVPSASQGKNSWDSASSSARLSSRSSTSSSAAALDFRNKAAGVYPPQSTSTEPSRPDFRDRKSSSSQSSDGFTFNPTRGRARPSSSSSSSINAGRVSPIKAPVRGANFGRSPSGRVIVRGLDRVASGGRTSASLQDQVRALRSREIRRSPDRSGYSNIRVTPVLNVPACMGPVLRGATKAGKGRLSNFRSFLTFKSKLPTSMSTAPIATR